MRKKNNTQLKSLRQKLRKSQTPEERIIWNLVRNRKVNGLKFFRQYSLDSYILDFYCPEIKLCIEIDGGQHSNSENKLKDQDRTNFLNKEGVKVIRFWNNDVKYNIEGVFEIILKNINS